MPDIEDLGIERGDNLPRILEKASVRRDLFLSKAGSTQDEVAQSLLHLSAEVCELEKLLANLLPMLER
jgi:hypothetical protein